LRRCLADLTAILGQRWWDPWWDTASLPTVPSTVLSELLFFGARNTVYGATSALLILLLLPRKLQYAKVLTTFYANKGSETRTLVPAKH